MGRTRRLVRKSGAGPAAREPPTMVSVFVSSVISLMPKPAAALVRDLPMCVLAALIVGKPEALVNVQRCSQQTQTYRVVCVIVIRRVKTSKLSRPNERASACNEVPL